MSSPSQVLRTLRLPSLFIVLSMVLTSLSFAQQSPIHEVGPKGLINYLDQRQQGQLPEGTNFVLIDVRPFTQEGEAFIRGTDYRVTPYSGNYIRPLKEIMARYPDKNMGILLYCFVSKHSFEIALRLKQQGYPYVRMVYGGFSYIEEYHLATQGRDRLIEF